MINVYKHCNMVIYSANYIHIRKHVLFLLWVQIKFDRHILYITGV